MCFKNKNCKVYFDLPSKNEPIKVKPTDDSLMSLGRSMKLWKIQIDGTEIHRWIQLLTLKISNDSHDGDLLPEIYILVVSRACITTNSQKIDLIP